MIDPAQVSALLLGAGNGVRMGRLPKAFLRLQEQTLTERALRAVSPFCSEIILGLRAEDMAQGEALLAIAPVGPKITLVAGGAERQETVARLVARATRPYVLLHEVVRPFAGADLFAAVLDAVVDTGAAVLCVPLRVRDALALVENNELSATLPRSKVVALQTPHAYRRDLLDDVHVRAAQAGRREDSTVSLVQWAGHTLRMAAGSEQNIKITYPDDWEEALALDARLQSGLPMARGAWQGGEVT